MDAYFKAMQRQLTLPEHNPERQQMLKNTTVMIIGMGGLGCPLAQSLAGMGIGNLMLVDGDIVEISNLHRQFLYGVPDIGKNKVDVAAEKLESAYPWINIKTENCWAHKDLLWSEVDIVADCTDNFEARYWINDICTEKNLPCIYGGMYRNEGQVALFDAQDTDACTLRDIFPDEADESTYLNCAEGGVWGALPNILGHIMAIKTIQFLISEDYNRNTMHLLDMEEYQMRTIQIRKKEQLNIENIPFSSREENVEEIGIDELRDKAQSENVILIDVRSQEEHENHNIGGECIPHDLIPNHISSLNQYDNHILYCQAGKRSQGAGRKLLENGIKNVYSLRGGLNAYSE